MAKVIGFSGSPRLNGNTDQLVKEVLDGARSAGAHTAFHRLADLRIAGCVSCYYCRRESGCAQKDDMQELLPEIFSADGIVLGSPVYMWQMSAQTKLFIDRLLPVIDNDFQTRLTKQPRLVQVYTQGNPDPAAFRFDIDYVGRMLAFLGFDVLEPLIVAGTRERNDIRRHTDSLAQARTLGKTLAL